MPDIHDLAVGARFLAALPGFFRHRWDEASARDCINQRLRLRGNRFLALVHHLIISQNQNPYQQIFKHCGMEYGDIESLVYREGLEGALTTLYKHGVYLTVEEFKGRQPAVRGSLSLDISPDQIRNPKSRFHLPAFTGGSRGKATPVLLDLEYLKDTAPNLLMAKLSRGGDKWRNIQWTVPGGLGIAVALEYSLTGSPPEHWFSPVDPNDHAFQSRYRHSVRVMKLGAVLGGVRLPTPKHVPIPEPQPIAAWIHKTLKQGLTPHLRTSVSTAVSLCHWARDQKMDLSGAEMTLGSEPFTPAKQAVISNTGAHAVSHYAAIESRWMGIACLNPETSDDSHFVSDLHAVIQPDKNATQASPPPDGLMLTTLLDSAPFCFINYYIGDRADLEQRKCGCPVESVGWHNHLMNIASHEKMTAGGMTFLDSDLSLVLEKELPQRFGGAPTDYQLVESEGPTGETRLELRVNPAIGYLDTNALRQAFLDAIAREDGANQIMSRLCDEAGFFKITLRAPLETSSGKINLVQKCLGVNTHLD